ncbi:hypothetical protein HYC85_006121 [Camellia sinensis]|uniref:Uncharacterized protein n=1 Tax=Camellia sinensis TaxID=4442 RepID=A0A7J7I364_CAMSI|nr:hypothetical protein HYC85_006121 [Camellia sinensis]
MQAVSKDLEKVKQELTASKNDGAISTGFQKVGDILGTQDLCWIFIDVYNSSLMTNLALKNFLDTTEAEVRSLVSLYSEVVIDTFILQGRSADSLSQYFGKDPTRYPETIMINKLCSTCLKHVTQILAFFVKMFNKAHDENEQQADAEKKKLEKEAMKKLTTTQSANDRSKPNFRIQKHAP